MSDTASTWQLRDATVDDLEAIMQLENSTFGSDAWSTPTMRAELSSEHTRYLVAPEPEAERDADAPAALAGYAGLLAPAGSRDADIQTIAVAPSVRRRGLGRLLMRELIAEAAARHTRHVFLEVRADNPTARALYESLGFEQLAVRKKYYQPDGVDAHVMRLVLP
jgi:ribosomal-protein-alanine acetyltransferase